MMKLNIIRGVDNVEKVTQNRNLLLHPKRDTVMFLLILVPILIFLLSFSIGRYAITPKDLVYIFYAKIMGLNQNWSETIDTVVFKVRLPRIIGALMIGTSLSLSGATYQGLLKNPMVSPDILGASAGASFGAAIALLLSLPLIELQAFAFIFGIVAVAITCLISKVISKGTSMTLILVLTGMVVSSLFQSFVSIIKYVADPDSKLPAITFWLMGGLSNITFDQIKIISIPFIIGIVPIFLLRWKLNVLTFGDEEAKALGINTSKLRILLIVCSTLLTTSAVSIAGIIGWVGLVIPHISRIIVGANYKRLIPCSILIGAAYLLLVDDIARTAFSMEIPIGILTSIIGAPFFIIILLKRKDGFR